MIFIGPTLMSGIGQVTKKYSELFGGKFIQTEHYNHVPPDEDVFIFALPIERDISAIKELQKFSKSVVCMSVCETETVHPDYGTLFQLFDSIMVPSEFCQQVFSRQFPDKTFHVLHHWVPRPIVRPKKYLETSPGTYVFYHIGNILDNRKNSRKIIESFIRLNMDNCILILKATCLQPVHFSIPNVYVINELLDDEQMQDIHRKAHCYVSFSNSEGVGMGAVEAAMNDKPVIITEYGGAKNYIKTPYLISCERTAVGKDDFLYTKDLMWGKPNFTELMTYMKDAYDKQLKKMDHTFTRHLVSEENIKKEFSQATGY
jgi:glycosyltransferase involved in cell wall biosynthesis